MGVLHPDKQLRFISGKKAVDNVLKICMRPSGPRTEKNYTRAAIQPPNSVPADFKLRSFATQNSN